MTLSPSPLLSLPAELRNQIVEYALTTPTSVLHHQPSPHKPLFAETRNGPELNQLKYTCRQLYAETAGLEVKYNALRFELPSDETNAYTSTRFPPFLYDCAPDRRRWLRDVVISVRNPLARSLPQPAVDALLALAAFSKKHPSIRVTYEYVDDAKGEHHVPKYQHALPFVSVAVCLGLALPIPEAWSGVVDTLMAVCGRWNLLLWSLFLGMCDILAMR